MLGRLAGFVALFRQEIGKTESDIIPLHNSPASIVRESRLWSAGYDENCCREHERSLNHRRFQNHLAALDDAEFGDVLFYYNSVRWLSRGEFLERFAELLHHIVSFLKEIDHTVAIFCTSSSPENSVAKTMNVSQTLSGYLLMCLAAWRPHSADDSLTSLLSTTFAASLQALLLRSQLFAKHCCERL